MSSIDNLQGASSGLLSTSNQQSSLLDDLTEQSINALTSVGNNIGESFSDLLSQSQAVNSVQTVQEQLAPLTLDSVSSSLEDMQNELLSNLLGYNSGALALASTEQITDISADFSLANIKESLQGNILSTLQANTPLPTIEQVSLPESNLVSDIVSFSFNDDGIGIEDAFDTVNVLQHIPVVSSIYSSVTEQEDISTMAQLAGDFIYGGPVGLAYSVLDIAIESYSGTSISDAITQFNYGEFFFSSFSTSDAELTSAEPKTNTQTAFYDKDSNVIYSRD